MIDFYWFNFCIIMGKKKEIFIDYSWYFQLCIVVDIRYFIMTVLITLKLINVFNLLIHCTALMKKTKEKNFMNNNFDVNNYLIVTKLIYCFQLRIFFFVISFSSFKDLYSLNKFQVFFFILQTLKLYNCNFHFKI